MKRAQLLGIIRETISMLLVICESFVSLLLCVKKDDACQMLNISLPIVVLDKPVSSVVSQELFRALILKFFHGMSK